MEYNIVDGALTGVAWLVQRADDNPVEFSMLATYFVLSKLFMYYYGTKTLGWIRKKIWS